MKRVELQEIAVIRGGGRLRLSGKDFVPRSEGFPAYGAGGLNGYVPIAEYSRDAVVLSSIGARCGKCFLAKGSWTSLANTQVILPDISNIDPQFLWYQINDERSWVRSGTGQPFIKPSDVKKRKILLPDLAEQRRIVRILRLADERLSRRRDQLADLRALELSSWFKAAGRTGGSVVPLGNLVSWRSGNFLPSTARGGGEVPVYGANGIIGYTHESMVVNPTLIVGRVGACGAVHVTSGPSWITDNALIASFDETVISRTWLAASLGQADLAQYAVRSSQPSISGKRIAHVPIAIPAPEVQREFCAVIDKIDEQRTRVERALALEKQLFASLRHRAFRGEL